RLDPRPHQFRHTQQPHRMSCGSRIEDDQVVRVGAPDNQVTHTIKQRYLLDSGHGRYKLDLALRFFQNRRTEKLCYLILDGLDVPASLKISVDLDTDNSRIDLRLFTAEQPLEDIRSRVRWVGRYQQNTLSCFRRGQCQCRCARRLAHSSLSAEKENSFLEKIAHAQQQGRAPSGE